MHTSFSTNTKIRSMFPQMKTAKPIPPAKAKEESLLPDDEDALTKVVKLSDESHPIQMRIRLENQKYWQNKFLFSKEYADFVI